MDLLDEKAVDNIIAIPRTDAKGQTDYSVWECEISGLVYPREHSIERNTL